MPTPCRASIATTRNCNWRDGSDPHLRADADLTVLVALFGAFALAYLMARRLAAPLHILAEGTQAVAQGDFAAPGHLQRRRTGRADQSFNRMTRQLDDARRETERHRAELESAARLSRIHPRQPVRPACWSLTGASCCVRSTRAH